MSEMPLFGKSIKNPVEVVKSLREAVNALEKVDKKAEKEQLPNTLMKALKAQEDVSKNLCLMRTFLYSTAGEMGNNDAQPDPQMSKLAQEVYSSHLLLLLVQNLSKIDFEGRKDVVYIFTQILRHRSGERYPTVEHIYLKPAILFLLLSGYERPDIALSCGQTFRECTRHESLAKIVLYSDDLYNLFKYVEASSADIAADAFASFKELLTRHKSTVAEFLEANYDRVFTHYRALLNSENFVTRRLALKLLGELLLDRHNFNVMTRYISNSENLKLTMNMLKDKSRNIRLEAFHVFKIFVANPHKPKPILDILLRNREKLVEFLSKFQLANEVDSNLAEQFNDEKAYVIKQIRELKSIPLPVSGAGGGGGGGLNQGPPLPPPNPAVDQNG
ncbi:protein Mo25-like isoform X1 [Varroa destructor]|uniref:Mo25-like protein n=2 Tax=Varroa destructor TaxID=109461 RepID=A0A7M7K2F3_VARDE|nr:protein Mo25-like isoform X1 [Varroa destructor]XP_022654599.1 protein Mo25-like isoform X1 [Varroa destructor]XP_022654601.1 protein Mo25-like isoform X1 [Varroa destructor]